MTHTKIVEISMLLFRFDARQTYLRPFWRVLLTEYARISQNDSADFAILRASVDFIFQRMELM